MTEFKPYETPIKHKVEVTPEEALLLKKIKEINYGQVTIHLVNKKIIRFETTTSELVKDIQEIHLKIEKEKSSGTT